MGSRDDRHCTADLRICTSTARTCRRGSLPSSRCAGPSQFNGLKSIERRSMMLIQSIEVLRSLACIVCRIPVLRSKTIARSLIL